MSSTNMSVFASYNINKESNVNKYIANTLEELSNDTQDMLIDHLRRHDGIDTDLYEYDQISKIKKEPCFNFDDIHSSTRVSFSSPSSENNYEEKHVSVENSNPPIWKYEMETTLEEGNTHRLLNMFEASYSNFKEIKNKAASKTLNNPIEAKQKKASDKKKIDADAFQLGRQKGIRDILASMVSPISSTTSTSLGSPDLSLSILQKENLILLNKLAGNRGSITRPNFEDTSNLTRLNFEDTSNLTRSYFGETSNFSAANISKPESRFFNVHSDIIDSKFRKPDDKLELEELIKIWLKPFWNTDIINKNEYKNIMLKCVRKISYWKDEERSPVTIRRLVEFYIKKIHATRKSAKKDNSSLRSTFNKEKGGSKNENEIRMSETPIKLDISNNSCNPHNNCSRESPNIEIRIQQSCCNTRKHCCKKSSKITSQKNVISCQKGKQVKRWRY